MEVEMSRWRLLQAGLILTIIVLLLLKLRNPEFCNLDEVTVC